MIRTPVKSSQITSLGHDPLAMKLEVEFKPRKGDTRGPIYQYANVTPEIYDALTGAESTGSYFIQNIKKFPDRHPFTKTEEGQ